MSTIRIPKGTPESTCKGRDCRAPIYWVDRQLPGSTKKVRAAVDTAQAGGAAPDSFTDGSGVLHSQYCPNAEDFR